MPSDRDVPLPSDARDVAERAARRACEPLPGLQQTLAASRGGSAAVHREAEYATEQAIRTVLEDEYPEHTLLLEENLVRERDSAYTWLVDPLDGTDSFRAGQSDYAVSIALYAESTPVVGVVAAPGHDRLFSAVRGGPATCSRVSGDDGERGRQVLEPAWTDRLEAATLVAGYDRGGRFLRRFTGRVERREWCSSAALNLCELARGRVDGHWEFDTYPWDVAGGVVIARAAGATVTNPLGERGGFDPGLRPTNELLPLLASAEPIHDELCSAATDEVATDSTS